MNDELVKYSVEGPVATIKINREKVMNAVSCETVDHMFNALKKAENDTQVKVIVQTASGEAFCTGFDLSTVEFNDDFTLGAVLDDHFHPYILALRRCKKPIVSAINGPVAGVGVAIALAGDIILARENAYFFEPFINIGAVPDGGNSYFLPRLIGTAKANAMVLLAEKVSAIEAEQWGLVWKTVARDEFEGEINRITSKLASLSAVALAQSKRVMNASANNSFESQIELEREIQDELGRQPAFKNAISAFVGR
ncbi:MAG: enoyl-CoA hydratase-related protein [Sneathiella sp.]